jgi:hypothetical protein
VSISFQGRFDPCESHSAMESQNEAHRGQCVDQKRPLCVGPKQTRTWESFWSMGPYWQLMGLNWKMMGPLRQRVGPIWPSSMPKMAPWMPIQLSNAKWLSHRAKTALAPKGLKRNLGSFWPFLIYSVNIVGHLTYLSSSNARKYFWKLYAHLVIYALTRFTPHFGYKRH